MPHIYLDEDVSRKLAPLLVSNGLPARTAQDENRKSAYDDEQLLFAAQRQWVFVTDNKDDYRLLHDAVRRWGCRPAHAGILVMDQMGAADLARAILDFFTTHDTIDNEL